MKVIIPSMVVIIAVFVLLLLYHLGILNTQEIIWERELVTIEPPILTFKMHYQKKPFLFTISQKWVLKNENGTFESHFLPEENTPMLISNILSGRMDILSSLVIGPVTLSEKTTKLELPNKIYKEISETYFANLYQIMDSRNVFTFKEMFDADYSPDLNLTCFFVKRENDEILNKLNLIFLPFNREIHDLITRLLMITDLPPSDVIYNPYQKLLLFVFPQDYEEIIQENFFTIPLEWENNKGECLRSFLISG